jgi:hypothetical protein
MDIRQLGNATLEASRVRGWAALETGISRPVPKITDGVVRLGYLLYRSQARPPYQMLFEPTGTVTVDFATGSVVEFASLPTDHPPRVLGRYPHAAAAQIPREQWSKVWDDLFALYPLTIGMFAGQLADEPTQRARFRALFDLTTPPFMYSYYVALNPGFFDWLTG